MPVGLPGQVGAFGDWGEHIARATQVGNGEGNTCGGSGCNGGAGTCTNVVYSPLPTYAIICYIPHQDGGPVNCIPPDIDPVNP